MNRIAHAFQALRSHRDRGLICLAMAGDPDPARSLEYFLALARGGADLIFVGVPFSNSIAAESQLRAAALRALSAHATCETAFSLVESLRRQVQVPLVLISDYNPVFRYGEARFAERCAMAGADGFIALDLPMEEAQQLSQCAQGAGVDMALMVTPHTPAQRLERIAKASRGFLYLSAACKGAGGQTLDAKIVAFIQRVRAVAGDMPLAIEAGLADPEQVRAALEAGADAAVVGAALVKEVSRGILPPLLQDRVRFFKVATHPRVSPVSSDPVPPT